MIIIDTENATVTLEENGHKKTFPFDSDEAFAIVAKGMLRVGWDTKYVYSFTWMGRPVIQLPDDMIRLQEVIYAVKPDVIVEIGVAHGGSLMFSASLCKAMGKGRVIGVDIEIRPHNRKAIEEHKLFDRIDLIEGDSVDAGTFERVKALIQPGENVLVFLDGCHTKDHVYKELKLYSQLIAKGSYIVAMDGIQRDLVGAPRAQDDWDWNHAAAAAEQFVKENSEYVIEAPSIAFNEGTVTGHHLTYWPNAFIKRK
jgi:cephalosporin hydroxylase